MKKSLREAVYSKCGGHCAYCGCEISYKQMHVDHVAAAFHDWSDAKCKRRKVVRGTDDIENLLPACARCNRWKATYSLEHFRKEVEAQVERLNRYSANYRLAKDYGLVTENAGPIIFYFERKR
jgi:5-methylcytosine-specific restriction endonuclease McrA